jgi:hypothetical protein
MGTSDLTSYVLKTFEKQPNYRYIAAGCLGLLVWHAYSIVTAVEKPISVTTIEKKKM